MKKKNGIVVITGCGVIQTGVERILSPQTDMNLLATATTAQEALSLEHEPDVVLLYQKPALEAIALLRTDHPALNVLVLSCCVDAAEVRSAFAAGALGYLPINAPTEMWLEAIRTVARGRTWLSSCVMTLLMNEGNNQHKAYKEELPHFTKREQQVLRLIAGGQTNNQIARKLSIVSRTVEFHQSNIYQKLNVTSRAEAAVWASHHGFM